MRYGSDKEIPGKYSKRQKEDIEDLLADFEHQEAFQSKFGDEALDVVKKINGDRGSKKGKYLIRKYGIRGKDISAVMKLIEAYIKDDPERPGKPKMWLEGEKLIIESSGFCPMLETADILSLKAKDTCPHHTWPYFLAMCRTVNAKVKHKNIKWRASGDRVCREMFWIED